MGFNKRKMEDDRRTEADKEAVGRRALTPRVIEDAERLVANWNERPAAPAGRTRRLLSWCSYRD